MQNEIQKLEVAPCWQQQIPCLVSNYIYIIASEKFCLKRKHLIIFQDLKHKCLKLNLEVIEKYRMKIRKSIWLLYHA